MAGRPSKYSEEIADQICDHLVTSSKGLHHICTQLSISPSMVFRWLEEHAPFREKYVRAREAQADFLADEILEIADDTSQDTKTIMGRDGAETEVENTEWVSRSKLKVEARKWIASKLKPKKYGDKLDLTSDGSKLMPVVVNWGNGNKPDEKTD